jgi:hypothetical protein
MASNTLRPGDSGDSVKSLQEALNRTGASLEIDGKFGPLTEKALRAYQSENGYQVNGVVGGTLWGLMGLSTTARGDYTDADPTRFNGLPGKPDIWKNSSTGEWYAVYYVPGSKPPLPMMYHISSKDDLESFFGEGKTPKADKILGASGIRSTGATVWGSTDMIPKEEGDPWSGYLDRMERAKEVQPWLEDPEVFAMQASAWLEGRAPERWEYEQTDWWQARSAAERDWLWLNARDPVEAKEKLKSDFVAVYDRFRAWGVADPPDAVVNYMANKFSTGAWSEAMVGEQMTALYSGDAAVGLDAGLGKLAKEHGVSAGDPTLHTTRVKDLFQEWLGPKFPPSDKQVQKWAQVLRDDETAGIDTLKENLRAQRKALYPEYDDDTLSYDDIASPWRGFQQQAWGTKTVDETSDTFQTLVKMNDTVEGAKMLRRQGLKDGVEKVQDDVVTELGDQVSQVREAV